MDEPRTLVFAYSELGVRALEILMKRGQNVVAVYTHEDDPGERVWFRSVAQSARHHGIPVATPARLRDPRVLDAVRALAPELMLSFYYRMLLPPELLALPRLGAFNMHGSLLPRYRGRAPVNWAILHGETRTGATLHHMVERADAGDIVDQESIEIGPLDTAAQVMRGVIEAGCSVLERQLAHLNAGSAPRRPQDEGRASEFGRRRPEDGRIDWSRPAGAIWNLIRAVARPFPGAFTELDGRRLYVEWARPIEGCGTPGTVLARSPFVVAAGEGALEISDWRWDPDGDRRVPRRGARLGAPSPSGRAA